MDSRLENSKLNAQLWRILHKDFYLKKSSSYAAWISFIEEKDLGLAASVKRNYYIIYKIIDEQKWLLSKLKYGL